MADTEFIAIGDLHINSLGRLFPNYNFDANILIYKAVTKALVYARENGIQHIVLLGDIFDNPHPSQDTQKQFLQYLIKHNDLFFYIIPGNHDYQDSEHISLNMIEFTSLISKELKHVKFITKPELIEIDGVPFSFLPWPYCKTLNNPSVNIAHVEIAGSRSDSGKLFDKGYKISPNGVWYIGHLHCFQELGDVFYPGMLYQKTFGEVSVNKGFYHSQVTFKNNKLKYTHEWIAITPPYKLLTIKVIDLQDLKQVQAPDPKRIQQYRLLLKNNVELPIGFLEDNPHIIEVTGKLNTKEMSELERSNFSIELNDTEVNLLDGLNEFLGKNGLDKMQVKRASKIIQSYVDNIGV